MVLYLQRLSTQTRRINHGGGKREQAKMTPQHDLKSLVIRFRRFEGMGYADLRRIGQVGSFLR